MRVILAIFVLMLVNVSHAAVYSGGRTTIEINNNMTGLIDVETPMSFLTKKLQESRQGMAVNFRAEVGAIQYFPIYSIHNKKKGDERRYYFDAGLGYSHFETGRDHVAGGLGLNLVAVSHWAWRQTFGGYVEIAELPPLWIGPYIETPPIDDIREKWVIGTRSGIVISYRFLGGPTEAK